MNEPPGIVVEVVLALPGGAKLSRLALREGTTVAEALAVAGMEAAVSDAGVGVWGRRVSKELVLRDGDRVEIYRPLRVDPKESRRQRAARRTGLDSA